MQGSCPMQNDDGNNISYSKCYYTEDTHCKIIIYL